MRWFKHMTRAWDDEKVSQAVDLGGLEVYGLYFRLIEIIASNMEKTSSPVCNYSTKRFARLCGVLTNKFKRLCKVLEKCKLITLEESEGLLKVEILNIAKYRDEYSTRGRKKKSECRDNVGTVSGQTHEQDTDTDTDTDTDINIGKISAIKPPLTSGKISHPAETIQKFADALGAFSISEVEKANISVLIDKGCLPEDVASAKAKNPQYMKSLKSEWQMRCVITARDERQASKSRNQTQKEVLEELERTYGKGLQVVC